MSYPELASHIRAFRLATTRPRLAHVPLASQTSHTVSSPMITVVGVPLVTLWG